MSPIDTGRAKAPRPFTGRHMLFLMHGFFGVIVAVNITMAVFASQTWTGLVVQNSYVASQEFEEKRIAAEEQRALGWVAHFAYAAGAVRLTVEDGAGNPVELAHVILTVNRPVGTAGDRTLELEPTGNGYGAAIDLASGTWDAMIVSDPTDHGAFELHQRFQVEANAQ